MIDPASLRRRAAPIDRSTDRLVALGAMAVAVAFLVAAVASMFLPPGVRRGPWLPLHLALAGGATSAIAGVMPFFVAAFAAGRPSDPRLRAVAVGAVALGAAAISVGVVGSAIGLAAVGGIAFIAGIGLTTLTTLQPLGGALGPRRGLVVQGYVVALIEVAVGATLATLFVASWPPVVQDWARLKPAHAWLNLVGFVSLVIATTLLHFFPTVVGARIVMRPSARVTVAGLGGGAALVALGFGLGSDLLARLGAVGVSVGAVGLAVNAGRTWQTRARWTTDPGWHRFAIGGLLSTLAWFEVGIALAAGRVLAFGAAPADWAIGPITGPLVIGWVGLAIVASATHLLPAVGPGGPDVHGRQRRLLGRAADPRLAVLDLGVAALAVGIPLELAPLVGVGAVLEAIGLGVTAVLLGSAVWIALRRPAGTASG